jgi:sec-independent protein translocase protein TatA
LWSKNCAAFFIIIYYLGYHLTIYKFARILKPEEMGILCFMEDIGFSEILLILLIVVLLFGGRKIPELMKGIGQGMREFKKASRMDDEPEKKESETKETSIEKLNQTEHPKHE